jgi:hypothetical protein
MHQDHSATNDLGDLEKVRSEALHKVGRNVVNFAKIESGLKILLASANMSGAPRDLLREQQRRIRDNRKKTLGDLAILFNRSLAREEESPECIPEKLDVIHISLSLRIKDDKGSSKQFRNSLRELVTARNELIHHRLAELDNTSITSYQALIEYLEEQHEKIIAKLEIIGSFLNLLQASHNEFSSYLQSYLSQSSLNDDSREAQRQDATDPPPISH